MIDSRNADDALDPRYEVIDALVARIKPLLAGQPSEIQGAVLGEIVAIWLAGHPDFMRRQLIIGHTALLFEMLPIVEEQLFGSAGHPSNTQSGLRKPS